MAGELVARAANVLLLLLISRMLGAHEAGVYTLAFSYTMIATRMTFWGLDQLIVREIAQRPDDVHRYFSNFLYMRIILSGLTWVVLWAAIRLILPGAHVETQRIVLLVALSTLPESVRNLCESVFIVLHKMPMMVFSRMLVTILRVAGTGLVLWAGYGLSGVAAVIVGTSLIGAVLTITVVLWRSIHFIWKPEWGFCLEQLKIAWPLMLGNTVYVFDNRLDIIVLSFLFTEAEIGVFNAAFTIVSTMLLIPQAYQFAILPPMSHLYSTSKEGLKKLYDYSMKYMLLLGIPIAVLLSGASTFFMNLFGEEFGTSVPALQWLAWTLPLLFVNVPMARLLIAADRQGVLARSLTLRLALGIILTLALGPIFGISGIAISRLLSTAFLVIQNYVYVQRKICAVTPSRSWLSLLLAGLGMLGVLFVLRSFMPWGLLPSALVYGLVLFFSGAFSVDEKAALKDLTLSAWGRLSRGLNRSK